MQKAANYALRNGLLEFTRRRGYRGPIQKVEIADELMAMPFHDWPIEIRELLEQYAPGGLSVALVTAVNEDNSASLVLLGGQTATLPWPGIRWAKPFIDRETSGPEPETAADVVAAGDLIYIMPTTRGTWALAQVPEAQGAVVSIDPSDGAITALTGGFDFTTSKFNRAATGPFTTAALSE